MVKRTEVPDQFRSTGPTATEPQLGWARRLRDGKDLSSLSEEQQDWLATADFDTYPSELPKSRLSTVIEKLVSLPWEKRKAVDSGLDDGRYGVENVPGHKNKVSFFQLRTPKEGDWKGYQFTDQIVGHGKRYGVVDVKTRMKIHSLIKEQGANECLMRFGVEFKHCGRCGRELTDDTSRAWGIGPDCRKILGLS